MGANPLDRTPPWKPWRLRTASMGPHKKKPRHHSDVEAHGAECAGRLGRLQWGAAMSLLFEASSIGGYGQSPNKDRTTLIGTPCKLPKRAASASCSRFQGAGEACSPSTLDAQPDARRRRSQRPPLADRSRKFPRMGRERPEADRPRGNPPNETPRLRPGRFGVRQAPLTGRRSRRPERVRPCRSRARGRAGTRSARPRACRRRSA